ncbi:hypothetical protein [Bradyrhizobium sp.]|uniref:hypothetical protein n=1 Tax=Bradyrhizobium sp. TaxID=376 RepID=UPI003C77FC87
MRNDSWLRTSIMAKRGLAMLLSQAGRVRLGNMVDPKYTMGASVLKKYLVS